MARKDRVDRKRQGVTTVNEKRNVTTGKQFPLRLTDDERGALELLTEKIQSELPKKKISLSRVLRAAVYLSDPASIKKLSRSITDNT
jgi:hypothetical protein